MSKVSLQMDGKAQRFIMETLPGIQAIFILGFIPEEDEILEFTADMYAAYQRKEASIERPLYAVIAKNPKYSSAADQIDVLTAKNVEQLNQARAFLQKYALDHGVSSKNSDKVLAHAAKNMPPYISEGTAFAQPKLRVLRPGERAKTEKEQWMEFLAGALGAEATMAVRIEDENGKQRERVINFFAEAKFGDGKLRYEDLCDFDNIKDSIIVRPLNYQANISALRNYMYRRTGDVALVIYAMLDCDENGLTTTKMDRKIISEWNMPEADIFDLALDNTACLFRPYVVPLDVLVAGTMPEDYPAEKKYFMEPGFQLEESRRGAYNLFLENNRNAATAVFCKGTLRRLSALINDDLYIILASMSYATVHPQSRFSLRGLRQTAKDEKHNPYADPAEFLSDRVYLYSRKDDSFDVAQ